MFTGIDLYSDTMTRPTPAMKQAMMAAEVGDEQKDEDPTTLRLEARVAEITGLGAAMFFPTATLCNQVALKLLSKPGDELLAWEHCHLFFAEAGGPAIHSSLMARPIRSPDGVFTGRDVASTFRGATGPHYPVSRVLSVENTTNMGGGVAWPLDALDSVVETGRALGLKLHLDGSRLFNAAISSAVPPLRLTRGFDTVTLCFSKGLGCAAGAALAFAPEARAEVRRLKQLMGGALRQSGILAAGALYALDRHVERLQEDHDNARRLALGLVERVPWARVESPSPSTNMVFFEWSHPRLPAADLGKRLADRGLRFSRVGEHRFRAVTHLDVTAGDVDRASAILEETGRSADV